MMNEITNKMMNEVKPDENGILHPPNRWRSKITGIPGPPDPELLAKVETRVKKISASYKQWAAGDIKGLQYSVAQLTEEGADQEAILNTLFTLALEIRGQGGTFGYPLVSDIAKSLCIFVSGLQTLNQADTTAQDICQAHADAIHLALHKDGNQIENIDKKVVMGLNKASQIYAQRRDIKLTY